jgi:hypothetical protein
MLSLFCAGMNSEVARPNTFGFSAVIFLRLLALVHLIAFASAWTQVGGLIGPHGIAPAGTYFDAARQQLGTSAYSELPSLCWVFGPGHFLPVLCGVGVLLSLLLFAGVAPAVCLFLLWAAYLSLVNAGQMFFAFQWDGLLLESTLLAIFVAPWKWLPWWRMYEPPPLARWLVCWLLFRLMFFAGVVKLASGDPTWRNLTALTFHYETQPLPTPLAWYAHQMPVWWHKFECAAMFVIELGVPFLLFGPRRIRHSAALILAAFMAAIAATGNYTFFNALAIALCLFCIDDRAWVWALWRGTRRAAIGARSLASSSDERRGVRAPRPQGDELADKSAPTENVAEREGGPPPEVADPYPIGRHRTWRWPATARGWITLVFAFFTIGFTGCLSLLTLFPVLGAPPGLETIARLVGPLRSFNNYGLFAVMTHPRTELIIEGSYDGTDWHAYEFPDKPGDVHARPKFVAPLQPRLDWQLWFAALESPDQNPWVLSLCEHLLRGTPQVLRLIAKNPFADRPPKYIRVVRYEYHFTDPAARKRTGQWWRRTPLDIYVQPHRLK